MPSPAPRRSRRWPWGGRRAGRGRRPDRGATAGLGGAEDERSGATAGLGGAEDERSGATAGLGGAPSDGTPTASRDGRAAHRGEPRLAHGAARRPVCGPAGLRAHGGSIRRSRRSTPAPLAVLTDPKGAELAGDVAVPVLVVADPRAVLGDVAALRLRAGRPRPHAWSGSPAPTARRRPRTSSSRRLRALGETTGLIGTVETRVGDDADQVVRTTPEAPDLHALFAVMRGARARPTSSWRSRATRSPSTASTAWSSTSPCSPTSRRTTSTSTRHGGLLRGQGVALHARALPPGRRLRRRRVGRAAGPRGHRAGRHGRVAPRIAGGLGCAPSGLAPLHALRTRRPGRAPVPPAGRLQHRQHGARRRLPARARPLARPGRGGSPAGADRPRAHGDRHRHASRHGPRPAVRRRLRAYPRRRRGRPARPPAVDAGTAGRRPRCRRRPRPREAAGHGRRRAVVGRRRRRDRRQPPLRGSRRHPVRGPRGRQCRPRGRRPPGPRRPQHARSRPVPGRSGRGDRRGRAAARRTGRAADNTVLVLGKGHETGQEIGGVVHAFDDRDALRAALDGLVYRPEAIE